VDGFDQDKGAGKGDECGVTVCGLVTAHGNPLEAFELADRLLDSGAGLVEQFWKEAGPVLGVRAVWYDREYAALAASRTVGRGVITLVRDCHARRDDWPMSSEI
jgi:hypothetical protein